MFLDDAALPMIGTAGAVVASLSLAFGPLAVDAHVPSPAAAIAASPAADDGLGDERIYHRAADGMFYVDALVNGVKVRFLVDTGATHLVLSARDAQRVGAVRNSVGAGALRTAGGLTRVQWAHLDEVDLGHRSEHNVRAAVANAGGAVSVSLLGQDVLSRLASLTIEGDQLHLR